LLNARQLFGAARTAGNVRLRGCALLVRQPFFGQIGDFLEGEMLKCQVHGKAPVVLLPL
jgi:hypothetical protein